MDICAISDTHGLLPKIGRSFDLLLIGGDNVDLWSQKSKNDTISWYTNMFVDWINDLPFKDNNSKVVWIAGNHEVAFENLGPKDRKELANRVTELTNNRAIYLENESYVFNELLIYGTPLCKRFGNWAFNADPDSLKEGYANIPNNVDILLTHDAPYGISDLCEGWYDRGLTPIHIGNEQLRDAIIEKQPKINLHGHLHSSNHDVEKLNTTDVYCISILDESYKIAYKPLYLQL